MSECCVDERLYRFVATGLGKQAAVALGMEEEPPMAVTDSGAALLKHVSLVVW